MSLILKGIVLTADRRLTGADRTALRYANKNTRNSTAPMLLIIVCVRIHTLGAARVGGEKMNKARIKEFVKCCWGINRKTYDI